MDTTAQELPPKVGKYLVEQMIGQGAMGIVLLAKDPDIDRPVAVKLIQTLRQFSQEQKEAYKQRFYREAKLAGKLLHPGIVAEFDMGHTESGDPYIVMEHIDGITLKDRLQTGPMEASQG